MVAIIDTYDNLLTDRKQSALQPIEILRQLYLQANAGTFEGDLVERIIRCLGVYPAGSLVELNTGERAVVLAAHHTEALMPTLRLISSRHGLDLPLGPIVSLADRNSEAVERRIIRALDPRKERIDLMSYLRFSPGLSA